MNGIQTEPITLAVKERTETIRLKSGVVTSSHAFASLFIWQKDMGLSVYLTDDLYAVKCGWRGENAWFFPCGGHDAVRRFLEQALSGANLRLCYLREEDRLWLERIFPGRFEITETSGDDEYIYDRAEQEQLSGRKFSALRNHIHRARAEYAPRCEPLGDNNIEDALAVSRAFESRSDSPRQLRGGGATELLLTQRGALDVSGILVRVGGTPYAVVAGYPLSGDMFDISLAQQRDNLPGLGTYAKHALINTLPPCYTLINAEEDLGIEGLRTMKQRMRPCGIIKMVEGRA